MKKILVTGAGGTPATNFVRSLRACKDGYFIVGTDSDKYCLHRSESDKKYLVPLASDPNYINVLNDIIEEHGVEFLHVQNDVEMQIVSRFRDKLNIRTFLPAQSTVELCMSKLETYKIWKASNIAQPNTLLINGIDDLKKAFKDFGKKIWIRDTTGAGGRGSLEVSDIDIATNWLNFKQGWGKYTAAEYLSDNSVTWMSIYDKGKLVVAQSRRRLYWELSKLSPSGVTGVTGAGLTCNDPEVDRISQQAIFSVDKCPNGIFSVDLTYDQGGVPNPTEINIGRFFTTSEFFTRAGLNMAEIFVKLAFNEKLDFKYGLINPLEDNLLWIRGMDFIPTLVKIDDINSSKQELAERLKRLTG